ncbi:hypothetical protein GLW08_02140 [Pontibacillus yanchengensis]|uniref:Uncharacterized protein n=2 Tax=Pontibacillus yanchengensis TaxID=462910 RepID=A0ACC7VB79_9BACI|nr:spore coat protein YlbD [Pontibacillus yanchengensis]MYL33017.1 hypothetical protein [Pontibacillus yanchengensis]MYL52133.1 hypothetical protein [Pontibacillus yanchengensis]
MSSKELDPSVQQFKEFVTKYPKLMETVKKNGESWQPYYEKWVLLGEEDEYWKNFEGDENTSYTKKKAKDATHNDQSDEKKEEASEEDKSQLMGQLMGMIENVDLNKVQGHITQLNGAIQNIQTLVSQFQDMKKTTPNQSSSTSNRRSPFQFGRD